MARCSTASCWPARRVPQPRLLAAVEPSAASTIAAIPTAGVALVTLALPADGWPARLRGLSGYLVPEAAAAPGHRGLVRLAEVGALGGADHVILRVSLGRDGLPALHLSDDDLLADVLDELRRPPRHRRCSQLPSGSAAGQRLPPVPAPSRHDNCVGRAIPAPGIALAGASYHGIGIPACIRSGQQAAAAMLQR